MEATRLLLRMKLVASCTSACCCLMASTPTISAALVLQLSVESAASS